MAEKTIHVCDLCGNKIEHFNPNATDVLVMGEGSYQKLDINGIKVEICRPCCIILDKARHFKVVDLPQDRLMIQAGWVREDIYWVKEGGLAKIYA